MQPEKNMKAELGVGTRTSCTRTIIYRALIIPQSCCIELPSKKEIAKLLEETMFKMEPPASVVDDIFCAEFSSIIGGTDFLMTASSSSKDDLLIVFSVFALLKSDNSNTLIDSTSLLAPADTAAGLGKWTFNSIYEESCLSTVILNLLSLGSSSSSYKRLSLLLLTNLPKTSLSSMSDFIESTNTYLYTLGLIEDGAIISWLKSIRIYPLVDIGPIYILGSGISSISSSFWLLLFFLDFLAVSTCFGSTPGKV